MIGSGPGKLESKPKGVARNTWSRFPVSVINSSVCETDEIDICAFPFCKYSSVLSLGFGRGSRVEGTKSRVEGNMSRVEGNMSRVEGNISRVLKNENKIIKIKRKTSLGFGLYANKSVNVPLVHDKTNK